MNELEVRNLLNRYWEGETSLDEETQLRQYFQTQDIADEFAAYQPLFAFFDVAGELEMSTTIESPAVPVAKEKTIIRQMNWVRSAAAAVLLAIGLFYINRQMIPQPVIDTLAYQDTFDDPELAYAEFKRMMGYVSGKMNKGVSKANKGIGKIETLTDIIN